MPIGRMGLRLYLAAILLAQLRVDAAPAPLNKHDTVLQATCSNGPYSQCGATGYTGETCCPAGYQCHFDNEWWSACYPAASPPPPPSPPPSLTCPTAPYGQCGGNGYTGPTCCPAGFGCTFSNEWWSGCQELASPPSPPPPPLCAPAPLVCTGVASIDQIL